LFDDNTLPTTIPLDFDQNLVDLGLDHPDFNSYPQSFNSSRSPSLTHSVFTEYSPIQGSLATFDSNPTTASPRVTGSLFYPLQRGRPTLDERLFTNTDNMQSDWSISNHSLLTPRTATRNHQRESSLSSLGSNGPSSPFPNNNTITPYIASAESAADSLHDFSDNFQLAKSYGHPGTQNMLYPMYASATNSNGAAYPPRSSAPPLQKLNRGLHPPGPLIGSGTASVASSIAPDSPATPAEDPEDARRRQNAGSNLPSLQRTVSDMMNDDLVSPKVTIRPSESSRGHISPSNDVFNQTLRASYNHLSTTPMTAASRARSPFQNSSPLVQMPQNFSGFGSAQDTRTQHQMHSANTSTPQTISPKDVLRDNFDQFDNTDNYASLFPTSNLNFDMDAISKSVSSQSIPAMDGLPLNNYMADFSSGLQIPMAHPYHFHGMPHSGVPSLSNSLAPSRLGSAETGMGLSQSNSPQRPKSVSANCGTYSCTYHGCTRRFETPQLLQKHKKDGHRGGTRRAESVAPGTSALMDSQTGPHRCERINPSTGNPCNKDFSRPYDLTRHESTVHDPEKRKVYCNLCTEEKTFSRGDALTRHYRVCHPDHEVPGKHRRRRDLNR